MSGGTSTVDFRALHDAENADLSAYLHTLAPEDWDRPSLCAEFRVRDVVGHLLDGNELQLWKLPWRLARYGFSSDRSGAHYSRARAEGRSPAQLLAEFDARDPWAGSCKVFPPRMVLIDRLVHHQDIRRALGHPREVPAERLVPCLDAAPTIGQTFRGKRRARGLRFEATDLDWSWGPDGAPTVRGPGEAILMTILGRAQPLPELSGDGLDAFAARVPG